LHTRIRKSGMMARDALQPLGKLLAELLGDLCWIAKILVIDVYVLRDNRLYPRASQAKSASAVRRYGWV
jgi:hypothetical protein